MADATAICRFCHATCGLVATLEDGRVTRLIGDIDNPMYAGYSCVKGRNYHAFHDSPSRLRTPLRRRSDGGFESTSSAAVLDEIAVRTRDILDRHGPRSVAMYAS